MSQAAHFIFVWGIDMNHKKLRWLYGEERLQVRQSVFGAGLS
jgi:hypothetical protein